MSNKDTKENPNFQRKSELSFEIKTKQLIQSFPINISDNEGIFVVPSCLVVALDYSCFNPIFSRNQNSPTDSSIFQTDFLSFKIVQNLFVGWLHNENIGVNSTCNLHSKVFSDGLTWLSKRGCGCNHCAVRLSKGCKSNQNKCENQNNFFHVVRFLKFEKDLRNQIKYSPPMLSLIFRTQE